MKFNRRHFIKITGIATFGSMLNSPLQANNTALYNAPKKESAGLGVPENKIAELIETSVVSKEPGKYLIVGQTMDENGHVEATEPFTEPQKPSKVTWVIQQVCSSTMDLSMSVVSLNSVPLELDRQIARLKRVELRIPAWTIEKGKTTIRIRLSEN